MVLISESLANQDQKTSCTSRGTYNFSGKLVWVNKGWALNSETNQNVVPFNFSLTVPGK
jgi:hypothetical protein